MQMAQTLVFRTGNGEPPGTHQETHARAQNLRFDSNIMGKAYIGFAIGGLLGEGSPTKTDYRKKGTLKTKPVGVLFRLV